MTTLVLVLGGSSAEATLFGESDSALLQARARERAVAAGSTAASDRSSENAAARERGRSARRTQKARLSSESATITTTQRASARTSSAIRAKSQARQMRVSGPEHVIECAVQVPVMSKDRLGAPQYREPLIARPLVARFRRGDTPFRKCVAGSQPNLRASVCLDVNPRDLARVGRVEIIVRDQLNTANSLKREIPLNDNRIYSLPLTAVGPRQDAKVAAVALGSRCSFSADQAESDLFLTEAEQFGGQAGTLAKDEQPQDQVQDSDDAASDEEVAADAADSAE